MMIPVDLGLDMANGVGIMRRSCCGPKEVWKMSLSCGGWWFNWQKVVVKDILDFIVNDS